MAVLVPFRGFSVFRPRARRRVYRRARRIASLSPLPRIQCLPTTISEYFTVVLMQ